MKDWERWLDDLATQPLPGGVAAAAMGSAMGAALLAKAAGVTVRRHDLGPAHRAMLQTMADQAQVRRRDLARLAVADVDAYRAVLDAHTTASGGSKLQGAYLTATEIPICIAEVCRALLDGSSGMLDICWPGVRVDLEIGRWLLETGVQAGLLAAESNLHECGSGEASGNLQVRFDTVAEATVWQAQ